MKTRSLLTLLLIMACMALSAQEISTKQALKLIKKSRLRCSRPDFMSDDHKCMDFIYEMGKLDIGKLEEIAKSAEARQAQNQQISKAVAHLKESEEHVAKALEQIHREQIRYDFFASQKRELEADREAMSRQAPTSPLVRVHYSEGGMMYNPMMPMEISKSEDGKVVGSCGRDGAKKEIDPKALDEIGKLIIERKIYTLLPNYHMIKSPLPDIPEVIMLDGMAWHLEMEYADGTTIISSGEHSTGEDVGKVAGMMTDYLKHLSPNQERR